MPPPVPLSTGQPVRLLPQCQAGTRAPAPTPCPLSSQRAPGNGSFSEPKPTGTMHRRPLGGYFSKCSSPGLVPPAPAPQGQALLVTRLPNRLSHWKLETAAHLPSGSPCCPRLSSATPALMWNQVRTQQLLWGLHTGWWTFSP